MLLAVGLALAVLVGWNQLFPPPKQAPPAEKDEGSATAPSATSSQSTMSGVPRSQVATRLDGRRVEAASAEAAPEVLTLTYPNAVVSFSSKDGALTSWRLTDPKYLRSPTQGELVASRGILLTNFARSTFVIPPGANWKGEQLSPTVVRYSYRLDGIKVEKTFTVHPENYLVRLDVEVTASATAQQRLAITSYGFQDPKVKEGNGRDHTLAFVSSTYSGDELYVTPWKSLATTPRGATTFSWTGFDHPYLLVAMAPPEAARAEKFTSATGEAGGIQTDLLYPAVTLRADDPPLKTSLVTFLGPKYYDMLEGADKIAGYPTNFKYAVDLGWFKVIGRPMLSLLQFFHGLVGNWGIAIILLTVLVKIATLYWTTKSMRSMKAMAVLAPKVAALKDKYKDDNARLQQETMALYKHHGANPVAGCLPMFLQMPIWIALYRMLSSASELYLQPFVGGWIGDLTARDPFYILPVALTATMFLQNKLQPTTLDSAQQKMMMYGMPLMFGAMGLYFPSGLTLYMFTNTVLSALHSVYMNKFDKESLALAAKAEEAKAEVARAKAAAEAEAEAKAEKARPKKTALPKAVAKTRPTEAERAEATAEGAEAEERGSSDEAAVEGEASEEADAPAATRPKPKTKSAASGGKKKKKSGR
ncbi:MAG: membrane protein insertase YidC [Kofleriaceae bacterium]